MKAFLLLLTACATTAEPPTKIFDFAPRALAAPPGGRPAPSASAKSQLRALVDGVRPQLATCIVHGTLDVSFTLALDRDGATVETVDVPNACARDILLAMDTSWLPPASGPERWTVHAPLYTGER